MTTPAQPSSKLPTAPASLVSEVPKAQPVDVGTSTTTTIFQSIQWQTDVAPHFRSGLLLTGAFTVAWGWCLVLYAASHAAGGENPLRQQIGFAHASAPSSAIVLLLEYLLVCAGIAYLSDSLSKLPYAWSGKPAITAAEFVPSPFFAGKLMGYLAQFGALSKMDRALLNLAATGGAAALAFALPSDLGSRLHPTLQRWTPIVQNTLGFGLGIAWNVLLAQVLLPKNNDDDDGKSSHHSSLLGLVGHIGYLVVVSILTLRVSSLQQSYRRMASAQTDSEQQQNPWPRFWEHQTGLLTFALSVVAAFALVDVGERTLASTWYGRLEAIVVLLGLSALTNALVASVDLEVLRERQQATHTDGSTTSSPPPAHSQPNCCTLLTFCLPCVWCCCPWVPVLVVLQHTDAGDTLKEDWYQLIAMVTGLAASIEASNIVVILTNAVAATFSCTATHCSLVSLFCVWQIVVALVLTIVLLPLLGRYAVAPEEETTSSESVSPERATLAGGEKQPLLSA